MMDDNIFEQLEPKAELPPEHKKTVMASIELAKLVLDFADLFSMQRIRTEAEILATLSDKKDEENKENNNPK
jgi:hypothetical protein